MFYFKFIDENGKTQIGTNSVAVPTGYLEVTETEYNTLLAEFEAYQATIVEYIHKVISEEMTIEEVPEDYRNEVRTRIQSMPEPTYTLDEAATILASEVSAE